MRGVRAASVVGIERKLYYEEALAVATSEASADPIYLGDASALAVIVASGSPSSAVIYAAANKDDSFYPVDDAADTELTVGLSSTRWKCLPVEVFNLGWIKLVANAAGTVNMMTKK